MLHAAGKAHGAEATSTGINHVKLLMWTFLASECMFFGSLISTFLVYNGRSRTGPHPWEILDIPYTTISAFVLLLSSLMMVLALHAIQRGDVHRMRVWLLATAGCGLVFLGGQYFEFTTFFHHGLHLNTNLFGTTFFVLTGFHGAHVTIGVIWLLSLVAASFRGLIQRENSLNVEIAGLYWHFVDVVWIVIFTVVYLIPVSQAPPVPH
ncbi:MAG TPA: heme-copper oxidase subunit III [Chloroflexota bacterium]